MSQREKKRRGGKKNNNIYLKSILNRTIFLKYNNLGSNLNDTIKKVIENNFGFSFTEFNFAITEI